MEKLEELRKEIDELDDKIIELLTERFKLTDEVGIYKKEHNIGILNSKREEEILNKIHNTNVIEVYKEILNVSKFSQGK